MKVRPRISVIVPTRARPRQLAACLDRLARQTVGGDAFEVIVTHDGPDPEGAAVARTAVSTINVKSIEAERLGNAHTKNVGLRSARAPLVLFINDDILPEPEFIEAHLRAHEGLGLKQPALIVGHSPFTRQSPNDEALFDLMLRETSLIFFYDRMIDADGRAARPADHDWGFRHAWSLNLSVPTAAAVDEGGFRPAIANCCYEDIEFAFRLNQASGAPVLFRPEARAEHDHRISIEDYFRREWRLGYSAYGFAHAAPECARATFSRDLLAQQEVDASLDFIQRESAREAAAMERFRSLALLPVHDLGAPDRRDRQTRAFEVQLPLKRLAWRRGFLAAAAGKIVPDLFHPAHELRTAPGLAPAPMPSV